jgi:hypothetical protein
MPSGSSYTNVFGGGPVKPSQPAYEALTISANQALAWPLETVGGVPYVAAQIDVTASAINLQLQMPPANQGSSGVQTMVSNVGGNTFTVTDQAGNQIAQIAATQSWLISLTDNSTLNGSWRAIQMGATVASAVSSGLAGTGLQANGSLLDVIWNTTSLSANTLLTNSFGATEIVWTGGAGNTLQLDTIANLSVGWYCAITNEGTGAVTLIGSSGQTINGQASITIQPGNSGIIICGSTGFNTIGFLPTVVPIASGGTGASDANDALTNFGGSIIGKAIFTAPTASSIVSLLGLGTSILTERTVSTNQNITGGSNGIAYVATAGITVGLALSTVLTTSFAFLLYAQAANVLVQPLPTDTIDGLTMGSPYTLYAGSAAWFVTDGAGHWYPIGAAIPMSGGTGAGAISLLQNVGVFGTLTTVGPLTCSNIATFNGQTFFNAEVNIGAVIFASGDYTTSATGWFMDPTGTGHFSGSLGAALISANSIMAGSFIAASDERLKNDITDISPDLVDRYIELCRPISYTKKGIPSLGLSAQHEASNGFAVYKTPNHDLKERVEPDGTISPAGEQLNIDYLERVPIILAALKQERSARLRAEDRLLLIEQRLAKLGA